MSKVSILAAVLLAATLLTARAQGQTDLLPTATLKAYGIFKVVTEEMKENAPKTTSGVRTVAAQAFIEEPTDKIPASMGVRFGIEYSIVGLPTNDEVVIRKVVNHPPITTPDGTTKQGYTLDLKSHTTKDGTVSSLTGYGFDHAYELVPGEWKIELWYNNRKLLEKSFTVYRP